MMDSRDIEYYMSLPYKIEITPNEEEGGFDAAVPDLKGCVAFGETIPEVVDIISEVKQNWFEVALDQGWPIPEPAAEEFREYSGRFNLRLPRYLHRQLSDLAESMDSSMNQLAVSLLAEGVGRLTTRPVDTAGAAAAKTMLKLVSEWSRTSQKPSRQHLSVLLDLLSHEYRSSALRDEFRQFGELTTALGSFARAKKILPNFSPECERKSLARVCESAESDYQASWLEAETYVRNYWDQALEKAEER
jgi:antitoxin HicB